MRRVGEAERCRTSTHICSQRGCSSSEPPVVAISRRPSRVLERQTRGRTRRRTAGASLTVQSDSGLSNYEMGEFVSLAREFGNYP